MNILQAFLDLQRQINDVGRYDELYDSDERLWIIESLGFIDIHFHRGCVLDSYNQLLEIIANPQMGSKIRRLIFTSEDVGANGTNDWEFSALAEGNIVFENLIEFSVQLTQVEHHNQSVISDGNYFESGIIAKLIKKMPQLLSLSVPSAPNKDFFEMSSHPLRLLNVQAGYDTQYFIKNLAESCCFEKLRYLDYKDFCETYLDNYEKSCTSLDEYELLFQSKGLPSLVSLVLRDPFYNNDQLKEIALKRKGLSVKVLRTQSCWLK